MEKLEKLYNERTLIKQLLNIDYARYSYLEARSNEIKTTINSTYAPIPNSEYRFALYDAKLANKITKNARINLMEINELINDIKLIQEIATYSVTNTDTVQLNTKLLNSINPTLAFAGLYPNVMQTYNIKPE